MNNVKVISYSQYLKMEDEERKILLKANITDYAILLGTWLKKPRYEKAKEICNGEVLGRMLMIDDTRGNFLVLEDPLYYNELHHINNIGAAFYGTKPVFNFDTFPINDITSSCFTDDNIMTVNYGEYPQNIVTDDLSRILEKEFNSNSLDKSGKQYTAFDNDMNKIKYDEYLYKNKKYVRIVGYEPSNEGYLSNGKLFEVNVPYWIEVEPIKFIVDTVKNIVISDKIILSSVPIASSYDDTKDFENTFLSKYLNEIFINEIIPSKCNFLDKRKILEDNKKYLLQEKRKMINSYICSKCIDALSEYSQDYVNDLCNILVDKFIFSNESLNDIYSLVDDFIASETLLQNSTKKLSKSNFTKNKYCK